MISSEYRYTYHQDEIYTSDHRDIAWVLSVVADMHQENSEKSKDSQQQEQVQTEENIVGHKKSI